MKTIIKIIKHQPEDKCVSVKICRLHSHKSIDDYDSKRVEYGGLNFTDNETFVDSLVQKSKHRVENQDDKESILDNNIPEEVSGEVNIDGLGSQKYSGGSVAAPLFKRISNDVFAYMGYFSEN